MAKKPKYQKLRSQKRTRLSQTKKIITKHKIQECVVKINKSLCDAVYFCKNLKISTDQIIKMIQEPVVILHHLPLCIPTLPILPVPVAAPLSTSLTIEIVPNRPFYCKTFDAGAGSSNAPQILLPSQTSLADSILPEDLSTSLNNDLFNSSIDEIMADCDRINLTPPPHLIEEDDEDLLLPVAINRVVNYAGMVANEILPDGTFSGHILPVLRDACQCRFCSAFYFREERANRSVDSSLCCQRGKVVLEPLGVCPPILHQLLTARDNDSNHFRQNIRYYNAALTFASTVANYQQMGVGPQVVKVNGVVHHILPQIQPADNRAAKFGQLYFMDTADCLEVREQHSPDCLPYVLRQLDAMLREVNPYPEQYRMLRTVYDQQVQQAELAGVDVPEIMLAIAPNINQRIVGQQLDANRYNIPVSNEIAAIFIGDEPPFPVDIRLYPTHGEPQTIRDLSPLIDPLSYPLLFPYGEPGWNIELRHVGPNATRVYNRVSCREFACYRLAIRPDFSTLHFSRKLFQQWLVDTWCRVEGLNLHYLRENQKQIHVDNYTSLLNYVRREAERRHERVGRIYILPSTFVGSPRFMQQKYLDSMAIVATYGKPDLFITMTCNPTWPEITNNLEPGQEAVHRPDLVCRVFQIKFQHLITLLMERNYFGRIKSLMYVIEFQKRGLPHGHILIILDRMDKIVTVEQVDRIIRAELPNEAEEQELHELVTRHLIHRKCGAGRPGVTCMQQGQCRWRYPKEFREETELVGNATYAQYRRRDDGRTFSVGNTVYDNRDVVPHSPVLIQIFKTHINVEICASIKATKYLYKYVHKGHDGIVINVQQGTRAVDGVFNWDEIEHYQDCRYVSAHEAYWRLIGFPTSFSNISVFSLQIHLPNMQTVAFNPNNVAQAIQNAADRDTHLLAWFKLNQSNVQARQYLFVDIVEFFTWQRTRREWTVRKSHFNVIGRLPDISPRSGDLFYLRMLLSHVRGATSFQDIRTVHGQVHPTFRAACLARHLIQNDREYHLCLEEAAVYMVPILLRKLFANIVLWCDPHSPADLWDAFSQNMCEDLLQATIGNTIEEAKLLALEHISVIFRQHNKTLQYFGLPVPDPQHLQTIRRIVDDVGAPNILEFQRQGQLMIQSLNPSQRQVLDHVLTSLHQYISGDRTSKLIFIDGPAGTGKTFFYNCLLNVVKGMGLETTAVAFTGIAAVLLLDGVTSHTQFGIPIPCDNHATSNLNFQDHRAIHLLNTSIIIWDEASMTSKNVLECADRFLRELTGIQNSPFGGKVLVMGGDFRQLLPVKRRGNKLDILNLCLKSSLLWPQFQIFHFQENMRADPTERIFAANLLNIGEGNHQKIFGLPDEYLKVPTNYLIDPTLIINEVFGDNPVDVLYENRAILTPTNEDAFRFNTRVLQLVNGQEHQYISVDTIQNHNQQDFYIPLDIIHKQTPLGCPPHILILKENTVVMLLRNLDISAGLCNGTRMRVVRMDDHVITTEILLGPKAGTRAYIPRMNILCERQKTDLPFEFMRRQFPLRLAYAMTINKSQGQTLQKVGLFLPSPVFSHGQFYVALSRARREEDIKISVLTRHDQGKLNSNDNSIYTKNIVFQEVL